MMDTIDPDYAESFERICEECSPSEPSPPADRREIVAQVPAEKLIEWASDFEAAAHEVPRGIKATVLMTRAQEMRTILAALAQSQEKKL